jgi:hypothetical protein
MSGFIEEHCRRFGVEPICRTLRVSASAYYERRGGRRSERPIEDERLLAVIKEATARPVAPFRSAVDPSRRAVTWHLPGSGGRTRCLRTLVVSSD